MAYNKNKKWLALFSQTGSEICDIADTIGLYPDCVITDNVEQKPPFNEKIFNCKSFVIGKHRGLSAEDKLNYYRRYLPHYDIITLHGWLNIIPAEICKEFKIYNGHPGLINHYPELKGKDPQKRAWENIGSYLYVGSVIHKVTPEVDGGDVIYHAREFASQCNCIDTTFATLKRTSLKTWLDFFDDQLQ
jgi:folate-dependent phosphoribosylglycinamide formyltransferase PurN